MFCTSASSTFALLSVKKWLTNNNFRYYITFKNGYFNINENTFQMQVQDLKNFHNRSKQVVLIFSSSKYVTSYTMKKFPLYTFEKLFSLLVLDNSKELEEGATEIPSILFFSCFLWTWRFSILCLSSQISICWAFTRPSRDRVLVVSICRSPWY